MKALKTFGELENNDRIYYIDHKDFKIQELVVKVPHVKVIYYLVNELLTMTTNHELIPTKNIICPKNAKSILTHSFPPGIYFTNKEALEQWMKK